jgi:nucleoside-diphosphate-sugar epimerase
VRGSTTRSARTSELVEAGIEPFVTTFDPNLSPPVPALLKSDVLLCTMPPGRSNATDVPYADQIAALMAQAQAHGVRRVVYTSSTGVYPPTDGPVTEEAVDPHTPHSAPTPQRSTAEAVRDAEQIIATAYPEQFVILRLGGLFGPERHPGRFIAGRTDVKCPEGPVNMVHQRDVVRAIQAVLEQEAVQGAFNVVAPNHPTRRAFYEAAARDYGGAAPTFADDPDASGKRVVSDKLVDELGFAFTYPDPTAPFRSDAEAGVQ